MIDVGGGGVVLVLTGHDDTTADAVVAELNKRDAAVVRMDLGDFPLRLGMAAWTGTACWDGQLWTEAASVDLADIVSVYYRRPTRFTFPVELSDGDRVFASAEARLGLGGVLAALDAMWVNDPTRVAVAEYKPLQLRVAARLGLRVPRTLITNSHRAAVGFARDAGKLVCKALSSLVLNDNGVANAIYTRRVDIDDVDPDELATTAHLLQEWVPKHFDARVTMIGERAHAVAIHAGSAESHLDWRTDYAHLYYETITVPDDVITGMAAYLSAMGLHYGAFDFVVTPGGEWVFLECNPAGQWLWLQEEAGLPIAAGLAELLATGRAV